jgi:hypothetical protein
MYGFGIGISEGTEEKLGPYVEGSIKRRRGHLYDPFSPFNYVLDFGPRVFRFTDQSGLLPFSTMKPSLCSKAGSLHLLIHLTAVPDSNSEVPRAFPGTFCRPFVPTFYNLL